MQDDLTTIARFFTGPEAHAARIELESEGIACAIADETLTYLAWPGAYGLGGIKLAVREGDVQRAAEILHRTPAGQSLLPDVAGEQSPAPEDDLAAWFLALPDQVEFKIAQWTEQAGGWLRVDQVTSHSAHAVYALTLTDPEVPRDHKRALYVAQPHAHEPGATAGMMDILEQLITGTDLRGRPSALDAERILAQLVLTVNPIGNPQGRDAAPVLLWDGSDFSNAEFWCWMRGEDPNRPGEMWHRFDLWDERQVTAPDPVGIVYEQIDAHRWVEPNRSRLSSYFRLFERMDAALHYDRWLDLHQTEFEDSDRDCMVLLPIEGLASGEVLAEDRAWGQVICDAWAAAGYRPVPQPAPLGYTGQQAEYFRRTWGPLHRRMPVLSTEVKNNAPDAPPEFQLQAQAIAIVATLQHLLH
jgi:hypothetical protein